MVTVIGNSTALRRLTKAEIDELNMCKEVVWAILSKLEKHGLADSIHAPPGADIEDKLHRERLKVKKEAAISKRAVYDNSKVWLDFPDFHIFLLLTELCYCSLVHVSPPA